MPALLISFFIFSGRGWSKSVRMLVKYTFDDFIFPVLLHAWRVSAEYSQRTIKPDFTQYGGHACVLWEKRV
jgi:hypothetical protein